MKEYVKKLFIRLLAYQDEHPDEVVVPLLREKNMKKRQLSDDLQDQLKAFWQGRYPFDQPIGSMDTLQWWAQFHNHPRAQVLSVMLFHTRDSRLRPSNLHEVYCSSNFLRAHQFHA